MKVSSHIGIVSAIVAMGAIGLGAASSVHKQGQKPKDPCWFMSLKDQSIPFDIIEKRQNREMYGYPAEIPISEAIQDLQ